MYYFQKKHNIKILFHSLPTAYILYIWFGSIFETPLSTNPRDKPTLGRTLLLIQIDRNTANEFSLYNFL